MPAAAPQCHFDQRRDFLRRLGSGAGILALFDLLVPASIPTPPLPNSGAGKEKMAGLGMKPNKKS